jgi:hypothetical protein
MSRPLVFATTLLLGAVATTPPADARNQTRRRSLERRPTDSTTTRTTRSVVPRPNRTIPLAGVLATGAQVAPGELVAVPVPRGVTISAQRGRRGAFYPVATHADSNGGILAYLGVGRYFVTGRARGVSYNTGFAIDLEEEGVIMLPPPDSDIQ